jgi:hypothetical protein
METRTRITLEMVREIIHSAGQRRKVFVKKIADLGREVFPAHEEYFEEHEGKENIVHLILKLQELEYGNRLLLGGRVFDIVNAPA